MSGEIDEDAITAESLQAQIDMSMSFAQTLANTSVGRLGVGADTSEGRALSRDTARLKGQLVGKKRGREQAEAAHTKSQVDYEDAEESRAGAIKKKAKADPFAPSHKKLKAPIHHPSSAQSGVPASQAGSTKMTSIVADAAELNVQLHPPSPKKKKKTSHVNATAVEESSSSRDARALPSSNFSAAPDKSVSNLPDSLKGPILKDNDVLDILSTTSGSVANNDLPQSNSANVSRFPLASLVKVSPTKLPTELRDQPILNLEAISSDSDSEGDPPKSPQTVSKRKRKRRKKKKKNLVDNSPVAPEPAQSPQIRLLIT
ncbi:hypothetical protein MD484_g4017, partial [Candolleomyces efflorescens]